ncbi:sigma-70 family RNA polymerase sigma factor [Aquisphaera insulae]|uniref:sigma-70 family RNA polymerase sigma factor n=1 Tax=Aquisphaera insulae TaxID=2712864 RepID=UPI0013EDA220|nr:sigma-70 family RNA polymerase sigma factor [Aquisphaera insulae]
MGSMMADVGVRSLARDVEQVFRAGTAAGLSEPELIRRFAEDGNDAAFAAIVERHGPMVLGVCRRILGSVDADDAFQATFLVLVRRRRSLRAAGSLGPWLHGVAWKVATRLRADAARRRLRDPLAARTEAVDFHHSERSAERLELRSILDEEIGRLPEKYRRPVILCDLEGLPQDAAARRLCWPAGVLRGRLDRARLKLRGRLARRGVAPVGAAVAGWLGATETAEAAISPSLRAATATAVARDLAVESVARTVAPSAAARLAGAFVRRQRQMRMIGAAGVLAIAAVVGSAVTIAAGGHPHPSAPTPLAAEPDNEETRDVEISVVGPDGRSIPGAPVSLRTYPVLTSEAVRRGTFARREDDAAIVDADREGRLAVRIPAHGNALDVTVSIPGYGLYTADWLTRIVGQEMPNPLKIELEKAWTVGGVVLDPEGKPIEGARVVVGIAARLQPGERITRYSRPATTTDREGRWRYDRVPESVAEVTASIVLPGLAGSMVKLTRAAAAVEGDSRSANSVTLRRGQGFEGKIRDERGRPIVGARLHVRLMPAARFHEISTGPDGTFRVEGCLPGTTDLLATAPGRAMASRSVAVGSRPVAPIELTLMPARPLRIRILDHTGKPVSNALIDLIRMDGRILPRDLGGVTLHTDADGGWEWAEAPREEISFYLAPPGEVQRTVLKVMARDERQELRLPPPLVIAGRVIDAETRQPVERFRSVPGLAFDRNPKVIWVDWQSTPGVGGTLESRPSQRGDNIRHLVRIEADGYASLESREIRSDEGRVSLDLALTKARGLIGRVIAPDNRPAAGARIAILKGTTGVVITNGDFEAQPMAYRVVNADSEGTFRLSQPKEDFRLAIVHPSGHAWIDSKKDHDWDRVRLVRLEPWSRVEGTFRVGAKPAAHVKLSIDIEEVTDGNQLLAFRQSEATTGPDGRFVFERVFPGRWAIGRWLEPPSVRGAPGAASAVQVPADFPAGQTVHLDLGGTGRAVVGRLRMADGLNQKHPWEHAWISGGTLTEGKDYAPPNFRVTSGPDGSFRIDDLPPGKYRLFGGFHGIVPEAAGPQGHVVSCQLDFEVPPDGQEPAGNAVDLGVLTLDER